MLNKKKSFAFGKDVYLVGKTPEGEFIWLESPSWDCDWYWGFGYMESYTNNNNPNRSSDIVTHQHWSSFVGQMYDYNYDTNQRYQTEYVYHINTSPLLTETVLTDDESWLITDLMERFYTLNRMSRVLHSGTGNLTSKSEHKTENPEFLTWINKVELPVLFREIVKILSPQ